MATNEQSDERLRPTLEADRYKVEQGFAPGLPSSGDWRWIGGAVNEFRVASGQAVEADTYNNALNGLDAAGSEVRKVTTLPRDGAGAGYMQGQTQLRGSLTAPEEIASSWQTGGPAQKEVLRKALLAETEAGVKLLSRGENVAAVASVTEVGEGSEASLRVDWVAVGADRGKGLGSPYEKSGIKKVNDQDFLRESAERLGAALEQARSAGIETQTAAPEVAVPAQRAASPELPPPKPLEQLKEPLADSIGDALAAEKISREAAGNIWRLGRNAAHANELGSFPEQELRARLPAKNPFEQFPSGPGDQREREQWQREVVQTAAIEWQLIDNRCRDLDNLARAESKRQERPRPHPMKKIRTVRRDADTIDRNAAILAHRVGSIPPQERQAQLVELSDRFKRQGGLEKANREEVTEFVALRHCGNIDTARAAERAAALPEAAHEHRPTPAGTSLDGFG